MRFAPPTRPGGPLALGVALALSLAPPAAHAQDGASGTWALTNARIETVSKGVIEKGTIVIRDGLIEAVGASVRVPTDARVVDLAGRTVYPGLIDLTSTLGLPQAPAGPGGGGPGGGGFQFGQAQQQGAQNAPIGLEPGRMIAEEIRPSAADVRAARDAGITAVLVAPSRGAFRGMSALIPMRDDSAAQRVVRSPVALHMGFQGVQGRYPGTLLGVIAYERQMLFDAQHHARLTDRYRTAAGRGVARPAYDADLDALVPVVKGQLPAFFAASNENEIRRAVDIAKETGIKLTVVGASEGFRALDALGGARSAVVSVDFPRSADVTGWQYQYSTRRVAGDSAAADSAVRRLVEGNAATLHKAGVRFALASGGTLRPADFLANVRKAIAAGLPRDAALQALTSRAAEIAGVGDQLGSVEAGKIANLVVADGDLLGERARIRMVFVDGMRYEVVAPAGGRPTAGGPGGGRRGGAPGGQPGEAAQVAGAWTVTVNAPQGATVSTITLTQTGDTFEGQMVSELGTVAITDGQVAGRTVTWSITLPMQGQTLTVSFRGEVDGNAMTGTATAGPMGSMRFTGERRP